VLTRSENRAARHFRNAFTLSGAQRACGRAGLLAALAIAGLWSADAGAQTNTTTTITIGPIVGRRLPDQKIGDAYPYRNARRWWINYDECLLDEYFDFDIALTNPRNRFEVWAGNEDCGAKRSLQDRGQCWILQSNDRPTDHFTISIPVRNIVAHIEDSVDVPMNVASNVCEQSSDSDGLAVKLYFFISDGGMLVGAQQVWDPTNLGGVGFDLVGPEPPGTVKVGMGDSQLSVNISDVVKEPDRDRFAAFCTPAAMDSPFILADAGPPADAGAPTCSTPDLTPGVRPSPAQKCGEASETVQRHHHGPRSSSW